VAQVVEIATMRPKDFGLPLTTWSLRKLADFLVARRMVSKITANMIGRILRENGVTFQRTKTLSVPETLAPPVPETLALDG